MKNRINYKKLEKMLGKKVASYILFNNTEYLDHMRENAEVRIEWEKLSSLKLKDINDINDYLSMIEPRELLTFAFDWTDTKQGTQYWSNIDNSVRAML